MEFTENNLKDKTIAQLKDLCKANNIVITKKNENGNSTSLNKPELIKALVAYNKSHKPITKQTKPVKGIENETKPVKGIENETKPVKGIENETKKEKKYSKKELLKATGLSNYKELSEDDKDCIIKGFKKALDGLEMLDSLLPTTCFESALNYVINKANKRNVDIIKSINTLKESPKNKISFTSLGYETIKKVRAGNDMSNRSLTIHQQRVYEAAKGTIGNKTLKFYEPIYSISLNEDAKVVPTLITEYCAGMIAGTLDDIKMIIHDREKELQILLIATWLKDI